MNLMVNLAIFLIMAGIVVVFFALFGLAVMLAWDDEYPWE